MCACYQEPNHHFVFDLEDIFSRDDSIGKSSPESGVVAPDTFYTWIDTVISVKYDAGPVKVEVMLAPGRVREGSERPLHNLYLLHCCSLHYRVRTSKNIQSRKNA